MNDCHPLTTPTDVNQKLTSDMCPKNDAEREEMANVPYQEAVGSLIFLAQVSRPDIQFAVSSVSRFNSNPGVSHWKAVKRIFRYLKGSIDKKWAYDRNNTNPTLTGYCDADFGSDPKDRRSVTGYIFLLQNGAVSRNSKKQPTVALSTTEAEYMAMSSATQEAMWIRSLHGELFGKKLPYTIHCDNKGAIHLANTTAHHSRTKHIDIRHHFVRDHVTNGNVKFSYINTTEMIADFLTKPVTAIVHNFGCNGSNVK